MEEDSGGWYGLIFPDWMAWNSSERAVPCEATLEDLYLFYFPTEEGVK